MTEFRGNSFVADWRNGRFRCETVALGSENEKSVTLVVAGDWAPDRAQQRALLCDPRRFYGDILSAFADADLSIVNMEVPVAGNWPFSIKDGPNLSVDANAAALGLSSLGCSVACLANNHIMDFGEAGLTATLSTLKRLGIRTLGAGRNRNDAIRPLVIAVGNCRIGVLNVAEGEEARASDQDPGAAPLDTPWVCQQIRELAELVDSVAVIVHAGREYVPVPPPYIRETYRLLADAGASLVVGHHPHVPQGIEVWRGVPIVYSLGNFVFPVSPNIWHRNVGSLLEVRISKGEIIGLEIKPYQIREDGLTSLTGMARATFFADIEQASHNIASPRMEQSWDAYADLWWQLRLPQRLMAFSMLMPWQDLIKAIDHRVSVEQQSKKGVQKHIWRMMHRFLRSMANCAPSQREVDLHIAAIMRNRFDTPAHSQLYQTALARAIGGEIGQSAAWAKDELEKWGAFN